MDQPYKVRDKSRMRLKKAILALYLKHNDSSNYNHANAQIFTEQVGCELKRWHNKFTNDGIEGLTSNDSTNKLIMLRSNVTIT